MESTQIKAAVKEQYGKVAKGEATCGSLCGCTDNAEGLAITFGYSPAELATLGHIGLGDLGKRLALRCGWNGTAFTVDLLAQPVVLALRGQVGNFTDLAELNARENRLACAIWFGVVTVEKTVVVTILFF